MHGSRRHPFAFSSLASEAPSKLAVDQHAGPTSDAFSAGPQVPGFPVGRRPGRAAVYELQMVLVPGTSVASPASRRSSCSPAARSFASAFSTCRDVMPAGHRPMMLGLGTSTRIAPGPRCISGRDVHPFFGTSSAGSASRSPAKRRSTALRQLQKIKSEAAGHRSRPHVPAFGGGVMKMWSQSIASRRRRDT